MPDDETHEFSEADIASVVQQAMEGLAEGELNHEEQPRVDAQNHNKDQSLQVDDFELEIQRQLEAQFHETTHDQTADAVSNSFAVGGDDDDFAKEVERQLQEQMNQQMAQHAADTHEQPPGKAEIRASIEPVPVDYEQEFQRQIMDALGENSAEMTKQPIGDSNEFERDLQKQIMDAFNANDESINISDQQDERPAESYSKSHDRSQTTTGHHTPQPLPQSQLQNDRESQDQNDYEIQLQKQIMEAFSASTEPEQNQHGIPQQLEQNAQNEFEKQAQKPQDDSQFDVDFEQELQHQIMQAFNESQAQQTQQHDEQSQEKMDDLQIEGDDPFKDALAELVRNVVDAQAESDARQQSVQLTQPSVDEEEIDMNQIMQNALALAIEDPNALLQSLNISGDQPIDSSFMGQMLGQTDEAKGKKKTIKSKEKKPPKEKKPRQPRKTAKKRKDQPTVGQVSNFVPNTQFSITGIPFPQNLQHLPQSLQVQFQQQIQQQQQMLLLQQQQLQQQHQDQQLLKPQQVPVQKQVQQQIPQQVQIPQQLQSQKLPRLISTAKQDSQSQKALIPKNVVHKTPSTPSNELSKVAARPKSATLPSRPEPKHPKPAPAHSIIDSVKKVPPLVLLSKDTSIDLANSAKQKKTSLSIAETLALSRQAMSSGKFSSKLQETKVQEKLQLDPDALPDQHTRQQISAAAPLPEQQPQLQQRVQQQYRQPDFDNVSSVEGNRQIQPLQSGYSYSQNDSLQSTLSLANHMLSKQDENVTDVDTTSKMDPVVASPQLPVAPGTQGNALLNNIGSLLPNLPSHLTTLISSAISQALSNTSPQPSQKDTSKNLRKKIIPMKDETPEQQKERIRLENRERKKRWRDANRLKNQNNDLRARLKKRAIHLFGSEDSEKKSEWIEAEFEKRKNRRIIKSANLEDLTMVISETMNKLDIQSVNEETLSRVIGQIVTSSLSQQQAQTSQQQFLEDQQVDKDPLEVLPILSKETISALKTSPDNTSVQSEDQSQSKSSDIDLSNLITASSSDVLDDSRLQHIGVQHKSEKDSEIPIERPIKPISPMKQPTVPTPSTSRQLPLKRTSDVMNSFNVKKTKIPLIRMGVDFGDSPKPKPSTPKKVVTEVVVDPQLIETEAKNAEEKKVEAVISLSPLKAAPFKDATISSTPAVSRPAAKPRAPMGTTQIQRASIKIPSFKKPDTAQLSASTEPTTQATVVNTTLKKDKVLMRPKFGGGLRKPPAFTGLRKPGAFQRPADRDKKKIGA